MVFIAWMLLAIVQRRTLPSYATPRVWISSGLLSNCTFPQPLYDLAQFSLKFLDVHCLGTLANNEFIQLSSTFTGHLRFSWQHRFYISTPPSVGLPKPSHHEDHPASFIFKVSDRPASSRLDLQGSVPSHTQTTLLDHLSVQSGVTPREFAAV